MSISVQDREALAKLEQEFPGLIRDTNLLAEQVKKLQTTKVIPYDKRYEVANKEVPLHSLSSGLARNIRANNKKFFLAFEEALDNTYIINAFPHEATLFKVGVLYKLHLDEDPPSRVIEMLIAIRKTGLPDRFKYIEEEGKFRTASLMELAQQAYAEILSDSNVDIQQRFEASYEKIKKIYLGVRNPKQINVDDTQDNDINFPEIPNSLDEEARSCSAARKSIVLREYFNFTGSELTTLQSLIPEHQKNTGSIPFKGISLDEFMRACLSKQIPVKETRQSKLRIRIAAQKFILDGYDIFADALRAIQNDIKGQMFDSYLGYISYQADPDTIFNKIDKEHKKYQKERVTTEDCKLSGSELVNSFFTMASKKLNGCSAIEKSNAQKETKTKKSQFWSFNKKPLKLPEEQDPLKLQHQQQIKEMEKFQDSVEKSGAENMIIFPAKTEGEAGYYSIPKNSQVNEDTADACSVSSLSFAARH